MLGFRFSPFLWYNPLNIIRENEQMVDAETIEKEGPATIVLNLDAPDLNSNFVTAEAAKIAWPIVELLAALNEKHTQREHYALACFDTERRMIPDFSSSDDLAPQKSFVVFLRSVILSEANKRGLDIGVVAGKLDDGTIRISRAERFNPKRPLVTSVVTALRSIASKLLGSLQDNRPIEAAEETQGPLYVVTVNYFLKNEELPKGVPTDQGERTALSKHQIIPIVVSLYDLPEGRNVQYEYTDYNI